MLTQKQVAVGVAIALLVFFVCIAGLKFKEDHDRTQRHREAIYQLREQYPFASLETRLPAPPRFKPGHPLSRAAEEHLRKFESAISSENESLGREARLQKLHEGSVEEFVRKEGFGVARMLGSYSESVFANGHQKDDGSWVGRNKTSIPQPSSDFSQTWKEVDLQTDATTIDSAGFLSLHFSNMLHFANPAGFGVMKNRRDVAGFQAHQFNALHEEKPWKIRRLELVGLLLEGQPRVYVTAELPRMQEIRGVPTRSVDAFEAAGLEKLHGGNELFIRDMADGVRMLGAIRSAHQCIKCHGGERGALLGAFSYALLREP